MPLGPIPYEGRAYTTGRRRYRRGWFGRVVLQVETETPYGRRLEGGGKIVDGVRLEWRDARLSDLLEPFDTHEAFA